MVPRRRRERHAGPRSDFAKASSAIYDAADAPRSYRELLAAVPEDQVAVVFGEEDNRFTPR